MELLRVGQKLYYIDKITGDIDYVVVIGFREGTFLCRLKDKRIVAMPFSSVGHRLFPVSDLDSISPTGCLPCEVGRLVYYNYRGRWRPLIDAPEDKPLYGGDCHDCVLCIFGECDDEQPYCDDYIPFHFPN